MIKMKKFPLFPFLLLLLSLVTVTSCSDDKKEETTEPRVLKAKVMIISDVHLFDPSLLIALDVCHYNPQETAGSISDATLAWAVAQIAEAKAAGKVIMGMMHHGLLEHYTGQKQLFGEYVIDDWETVSAALSAAGLEVMFTGHYHAQDIAMREIDGKKIYDVETGSTVTWPCPYRVIDLNGKTLTISSGRIENIEGAIPGGATFQVYAKDYLSNGLANIAAYMLMSPPYNVPQEYAVVMAPSFRNGFVAHYAGDEAPTTADLTDVQMVMGVSPDLGMALGSLWTDTTPADNAFTLILQ